MSHLFRLSDVGVLSVTEEFTAVLTATREAAVRRYCNEHPTMPIETLTRNVQVVAVEAVANAVANILTALFPLSDDEIAYLRRTP